MAKIITTETDKAIKKFADRVIKDARKNLIKDGKKASGSLVNSLDYHYKDGLLMFEYANYGRFIDAGVSGTGRPTWNYTGTSSTVHKSTAGYSFKKGPVGPEAMKSFAGWMRDKRIFARNVRGQFVSPKSLNFLIRRSVKHFGIKPTGFFSKALAKNIPGFEKEVDSALGKDIRTNVDRLMHGTLKGSCNVKAA